MSIDNIHIRVSPFTDRILLARFGKDQNVALETRDAMNEFLQALVQYAFGGDIPKPGEATEVTFGGGDEQFEMMLRRSPINPV